MINMFNRNKNNQGNLTVNMVEVYEKAKNDASQGVLTVNMVEVYQKAKKTPPRPSIDPMIINKK